MLSRESTPLDDLLDERPVIASTWGLERIEALLEQLGRPERSFQVFHIAGTNGKGSTASFASSVLRAAGFETALYTSPHLSDVRERFRVGSRPVPEDLLQVAAARLLACDAARDATYFEVLTALAFVCFADHGVEIAVVETGLGGRLDATNVVHPLGTAITSIGLDHTELLGSSLAAVAGEKAGIVKPGVPVAVGRLQPEASEAILARAQTVGAPLHRLGHEARLEAVEIGRAGTSFTYRSSRWPEGLALKSGLRGAHQADNAAVAGLMLEAALPDLGEQAWIEGIRQARLPGRFEVHVEADRTWVFDIAHNPPGIRALLDTIRRTDLPRPWIAVVSILADKSWKQMLDLLRVDTDAIILTQAASAPESRRWNLEEAERHLAPEARQGGARVIRELGPALDAAAALSPAGTVVVTGSVHTVGDARALAMHDVGLGPWQETTRAHEKG